MTELQDSVVLEFSPVITVGLGALNLAFFVLWTLLWWGLRRMVHRQDKTEEALQRFAIETATHHATREDLRLLEQRLTAQIQASIAPAAQDLTTIKQLLLTGGRKDGSR